MIEEKPEDPAEPKADPLIDYLTGRGPWKRTLETISVDVHRLPEDDPHRGLPVSCHVCYVKHAWSGFARIGDLEPIVPLCEQCLAPEKDAVWRKKANARVAAVIADCDDLLALIAKLDPTGH